MAPGTRLFEEAYAALHYSANAVVWRLPRVMSQHLAYWRAINDSYAQATGLLTCSCIGVEALRMLSVLYVHVMAAVIQIATYLEPLQGSCQPFRHRR